MKNYDYVIIGGGMTGAAAVDGIRELDSNGSILLFSAEKNLPYNRPPLSKSLWKGKPVDSIWRTSIKDKAEIIVDRKIEMIFPEDKQVIDNIGNIFTYKKLLLATGGKPRRLSFNDEKIIYYRTLDDYQRLKTLSGSKSKFAVIGTGFIGTEISSALAINGIDVTMFEAGPGIGWNIFPPELTSFLNDYFSQKNIDFYTETSVKNILRKGNSLSISTDFHGDMEFDAIIAGIGIIPDTELAEKANLKVENGIVVNEFLETSFPDIFAAGDVANFYNPLLGRRIRVEHADNAERMGKQAGRNMTRSKERYDYLPFFYSDIFELGYEAIGILDSRAVIIQDWTEQYKKGVLYYLNEERVIGVLLWNVWDRVDDARKIIGLPAPVNASKLIGRI